MLKGHSRDMVKGALHICKRKNLFIGRLSNHNSLQLLSKWTGSLSTPGQNSVNLTTDVVRQSHEARFLEFPPGKELHAPFVN